MDTRASTSPENLYFEPLGLGVERPSTSTSSRDTASPIMSSRAIVDNAKVFPLFAKRLASHDVKEYTATAKKMRNWLGSEKAYYPEALRNIVSLLEIAHSTFTTEFTKTASSALAVVDIYHALISAVVPYLHYFREGDLQLRLKHLIKSCSEISNDFTPLVQAGREATFQECKNAPSVITSGSDITPNTQVRCTSAQVRSPVTMQASSTSIHIPADLPPSAASSMTSISKPQPKRLPKGPSLSEHLKNRDLEWFKAHQQPAGLVVDKSAQPSALEFMHDATGLLTAEKLRPSRMPARIPLRSPCGETMTSTEVTAPADVVGQSNTSHSTDAPAHTDFEESKNATPAVIDAAVSNSQPEDIHHDSAALPSHAQESSVPDVPTTQSPEPRTESPVPMPPHSIFSGDVGEESHRKDSLPSREVDVPLQIACPRFGGDMAVMMFRQGLQSHCGILNINFDLDDTRYSQIAQWTMRKSSPTDVAQSVCVSFACYHLPSLLSIPLEDGELPPFETLTMHTSCSWPTTGDLSLQTTRDGKNFVIPLAPPIFVTPDNCVDISSFIRKGENALSVVQQSDMSEYIFMLHAHHPTSAQLKYLASCRHKRDEWARIIRTHYKPEPMESLWRRSPSRS